MKLLLVLYLIWPASGFGNTQQFPLLASLDNLVDQFWTKSKKIMVVEKKKLTKKDYEAQERMGANGTGKDRLKVLFQNGGNKEKTFDYIEDIESMLSQTRPHVFFMSECLLDDDTKSRLENIHHFVTEEMAPGERIWAAVRNTVPYKRRKDLEIPGITSLWLEFGSGAKRYMIIGVYREFKRLKEGKRSRDVSQQIIRWRKFMDRVNTFVLRENIECHMLGDMNLNTEKWVQLGCRNPGPYQKMVDLLYEKAINGAGFVLSETEGPTWISTDGSKSSHLDIHLCNDPSKLKSVTTTKEFKGDHHALIMVRSETDTAGNMKCTKRKWSKVDYIWVFCTYYVFWSQNVHEELLNIHDPDVVAEKFTAILSTILDEKWPVTTFTVKPNYSPYVTKKLLTMRKEKKRLYNEWKKDKTMEKYKAVRSVSNKLRQATKKARMRYYGRRMGDYKDSKKLWEYAKDLLNWRQDGGPTTIIVDGVRYTDPKQVADMVNKELIKKVKDILANLPAGVDPLSYTREWLEDKEVPEVNLTEKVTQAEVEEAFKSLNWSDAAGHDNLTTRLVKSMGDYISPVMTHLINLCFEQNRMPTVFKLAKISPLFKGGDRFNARNYRPVAILPALSKVIERIVFGRLKNHLETNHLLTDTQNAYREKRSVTTAMLQLYDEVVKYQADGVDSACVFLDCSAAFDTIQHSVLLDKLKLYGASKKSMDWFKDYLGDRAQYVSVGGTRSDIIRIMDGCFQGSLGGPWCYLLIINDIVIVGYRGGFTVYIYADDNCLRISLSGNIAEDQAKLDNAMREIVLYMNSQKLKFNFKKTEWIVAAPKRHDDYKDLVLNFDGEVVKQQLHARLLGLQVSWDLSHVWYIAGMKDNLLASLSQRLYALRKLANKCPKKCLKNLAHGLIFSKISFGLQYWSQPMPVALWNKLEVILNHTARAVLRIKPLHMHVKDCYRVLSWHTLKSLKSYHELLLFWSIKAWKKPRNLSIMFESHQERLARLDPTQRPGEQETWVPSDRGGYERVVTRSITQQSINRTQENESRNDLRHESFVPRMVRRFNTLAPEYRQLPTENINGRPARSEEEQFAKLKLMLRELCLREELGDPLNWPSKEEAMLDRGNEIYGGLNMDSTDEEIDT